MDKYTKRVYADRVMKMSARLAMLHIPLLLLYLAFVNIAKTKMAKFKASQFSAYNSAVELTGAVADTTQSSLIGCLTECARDAKCLTFFYNMNTGRCVMHSKHFFYTTPQSDDGDWKYYRLEDVSTRCPSPYLLYRHLNLCYSVKTIASGDFSSAENVCSKSGGRMFTPRNQEFQDYFAYFLEGRQHLVLLSGYVDSNGTVTLDDGTVLSYYNWGQGQPNSEIFTCLIMFLNDLWYDTQCVLNQHCIFVCEI